MADRKTGTCLMAFECFLYRKEKVYRGKVVYWKCVEYYGTSKCRGRLHSLGDRVVRTTKYHNHQPDAALMVEKSETLKPIERPPYGYDSASPAPRRSQVRHIFSYQYNSRIRGPFKTYQDH